MWRMSSAGTGLRRRGGRAHSIARHRRRIYSARLLQLGGHRSATVAICGCSAYTDILYPPNRVYSADVAGSEAYKAPPTLPMLLRALLVCALVLCVDALNASYVPRNDSTSVAIECCALWGTLNEYIQTHSGVDRSHCDSADCMHTGQIQSFLEETNAVVAGKLRVEGSTIVFSLATADEMQRLLVWSFLGRHFTSTRQEKQQDDFFFEFNIATRTMALRKIQCEFQKPVYVSMIVLTIIVLLFIIASRILAKSLEPPAAPAASGVTIGASFTAGAPFSGFAPLPSLRYRAVPSDAW